MGVEAHECRSAEKTKAACASDSFEPAGGAQLRIRPMQVRLDRAHADDQGFGDLLVGLSLGQELQDLDLAGTQRLCELRRAPDGSRLEDGGEDSSMSAPDVTVLAGVAPA